MGVWERPGVTIFLEERTLNRGLLMARHFFLDRLSIYLIRLVLCPINNLYN
jgi:hypothetical protein